MSRSRASNWFKFVTLVSFGGFTALLAVSLTQIQDYARVRAGQYAAKADASRSKVAKISNYRLANVLDSHNSGYRLKLANSYANNHDLDSAVFSLGSTDAERVRKAQLLISIGKMDDAIATVDGLSSPTALITRSRAQLEKGSTKDAVDTMLAAQTDEELTQLSLSQAADGETDAADGVALQVGDTVLRGYLRGAAANKVSLAQELYILKLHRTALRVLNASTDTSSAKYRLLAQIYLEELPSKRENLVSAQEAASKGVKLDPANIDLRKLLRDIDKSLGLEAAAGEQQQRVDILTSGSI